MTLVDDSVGADGDVVGVDDGVGADGDVVGVGVGDLVTLGPGP